MLVSASFTHNHFVGCEQTVATVPYSQQAESQNGIVKRARRLRRLEKSLVLRDAPLSVLMLRIDEQHVKVHLTSPSPYSRLD
jgi:hypothetical protein